ncbi:MAG: hypothetical protein LKJ21_03490 [Oscillospiraceae bacterium]|jgi:hypothetical protein|nr:hypothetical protein [Oscillospiraceae bacterium]MCI1990299.1 hypothetical protein [Oscillospiraceae bacterium]MCI2034578.1 hypothetical protein [Oscillospiraceae bacterium]
MQNKNGNQQMLESLMKQLGPQDKKRLDALLSDKAACEKILNSPEAQKLMKELGGK